MDFHCDHSFLLLYSALPFARKNALVYRDYWLYRPIYKGVNSAIQPPKARQKNHGLG